MAVSPEMKAARELKRSRAMPFIDRSMRLLEIGPSYAPVAPKADGWNSFTVDHTSQDELRKKYATVPAIDLEDIEVVDFVWSGGTLLSAIPAEFHGTFDACIASHVLEHIPDPIGWLSDIGRLLKPGGILSLILPDKRFELDCMRPITTTGVWLDAIGRTRHTRGTLFDSNSYYVTNDGDAFWSPKQFGEIAFYCPFEDSFALGNSASGPDYIDAHAWCFTPSSFKLIMLELSAHDVLPFALAGEPTAEAFEFYSSWRNDGANRPDPASITVERMALLCDIQREMQVQANYMFDVSTDHPALPAEQPVPLETPAVDVSAVEPAPVERGACEDILTADDLRPSSVFSTLMARVAAIRQRMRIARD